MEDTNTVNVTTVDVTDGSHRIFKADRVFLAMGHFGTARLIARSLGRRDEAIRIADSQYFFFPMISYRRHKPDTRFTLAEMFVEILNTQLSNNNVHFQVYGKNSLVEQTLRGLIPKPLPIQQLVDRVYIFQGFLHSEDSGHLEMTLLSSTQDQDRIRVRGVTNPEADRTAKKAQSLLRKKLLSFGLIPPGSPEVVPPGRSFHTGSSFPIGGSHPVFSSDVLGRPASLKRTHIVDAANFPTVAGSTITFTIMANSDRIINATIAGDHA